MKKINLLKWGFLCLFSAFAYIAGATTTVETLLYSTDFTDWSTSATYKNTNGETKAVTTTTNATLTFTFYGAGVDATKTYTKTDSETGEVTTTYGTGAMEIAKTSGSSIEYSSGDAYATLEGIPSLTKMVFHQFATGSNRGIKISIKESTDEDYTVVFNQTIGTSSGEDITIDSETLNTYFSKTELSNATIKFENYNTEQNGYVSELYIYGNVDVDETATVSEANWDFETNNPGDIRKYTYEGSISSFDSDVPGIKMYVDATSGKIGTSGDITRDNAQFNAGTIIRIPVVNEGDVIALKGYTGLTYTIGGGETQTADLTEQTYTATETDAEKGYVEIVSIGGGYIYYVKVTYTSSDENTANLKSLTEAYEKAESAEDDEDNGDDGNITNSISEFTECYFTGQNTQEGTNSDLISITSSNTNRFTADNTGLEYGDNTYYYYLKMESSTTISFTTSATMNLTLVFGSDETNAVTIDNQATTLDNGVTTLTTSLDAGSHTITRVSGNTSTHIYYISLSLPSDDDGDDTDEIVITTDPASNTTVEQIDKITVTSDPIMYQYAELSAIKIYKLNDSDEYDEIEVSFEEDVDGEYDSSQSDYDTAETITLTEPITDAGTYKIVIPSNIFFVGEDCMQTCEITIENIVIEGASEPDAVVLSDLTLSEDLVDGGTLAKLSDDEGEESTITVKVTNLDQYDKSAGIYLKISFPISDEDGDYEGQLTSGELKADYDGEGNATGTYTWTCGYGYSLDPDVVYTFTITPLADVSNPNSEVIGNVLSFTITGASSEGDGDETSWSNTIVDHMDPLVSKTLSSTDNTFTLYFSDNEDTDGVTIVTDQTEDSHSYVEVDETQYEFESVLNSDNGTDASFTWTFTVSDEVMAAAVTAGAIKLVIVAEDEDGYVMGVSANEFLTYEYAVSSENNGGNGDGTAYTFTTDPADGATGLESISSIIVKISDPSDDDYIQVDWDEIDITDIQIYSLDENGDIDEVVANGDDLDPIEEGSDEDGSTHTIGYTITFDETITDEGTYMIYIPGIFQCGDAGTLSDAITLTVTIGEGDGDDTDDTTLTLDPASGTVSSLSTITVSGKLSFDWNNQASVITLTDNSGNVYYASDVKEIEDPEIYDYYIGAEIIFEDELANGTYTLNIPAGTFYVGAAQIDYNSQITATYTLDSATDGINGITLKAGADDRFYNLNGQRVTAPRNGVFILNGKKVLIK